ncbi:HK97-gp10 family putative phage morphogenesis protein [Devosia aurantiaca]|uniref:HK97 gp10 family phage protein n=1 Tax=Devosia aurantiaca TaxID=2714858 RepID=A0A6M1SQ84_9HYPH|nr:HK97-gp10 family putative phage morphogenesis protein [Devosia aurantiaca]NGP19300.1 HK97 gp10 family phage protein [Devosia aurantiaca]
MKTVVKVEGLRELDQALSQFTPTKRRAIGRVALDNAGEITAKAARALVPVDSGGLRESIEVGGTLSRAQKSQHNKRAEQERFVGPDGRPQGHLREFGGDGNPPQPFMRPAWDQTKDAVLQRIQDELIVGIEKAVQSAARRAARGK